MAITQLPRGASMSESFSVPRRTGWLNSNSCSAGGADHRHNLKKQLGLAASTGLIHCYQFPWALLTFQWATNETQFQQTPFEHSQGAAALICTSAPGQEAWWDLCLQKQIKEAFAPLFPFHPPRSKHETDTDEETQVALPGTEKGSVKSSFKYCYFQLITWQAQKGISAPLTMSPRNLAGFSDTAGKQPAAIVILLLPQTHSAGKEERFGNINRDQGPFARGFNKNLLFGQKKCDRFQCGKKEKIRRKISKSCKNLLALFKTA